MKVRKSKMNKTIVTRSIVKTRTPAFLSARETAGSRFCKVVSQVVLLAFLNLLVSEYAYADPGIAIQSRGPDHTSGVYREEVVDLKVKALGGAVGIEREWDGAEWAFNQRWSDLVFIGSGTTLVINQGGVEYKSQEGSTSPRYVTDSGAFIESNEMGFRWEGINRDWIQYDTSGVVLSFGDPYGATLGLVRSADGRITGVVDHHGTQILTIEYNGVTNEIRRARDYSGREVNYTYQGGRLNTVTDVRGLPWQYAYNPSGALIRATDPRGAVTDITYAADGSRVSNITEGGISNEYEYGYDSRNTEHYVQRKIAGRRVIERWTDSTGLNTRTAVNGTVVRDVTRDRAKRRITNRHGATIEHTLASAERSASASTRTITGTRKAGGGIRNFDVDSGKRRVRGSTSPRNIHRTHSFNGNDQITRSIEAIDTPKVRRSGFSYDDFGQLQTAESFRLDGTVERSISFEYDAYGNAQRVALGSGVAVDATYDTDGDVLSISDGVGSNWGFEYDAARNLTKVTDPLSQEVVYGYDEVGNLTSVLEADGGTYAWEYNTRDQVTKVTGAIDDIWTHEYDDQGNLETINHPEGLRERFGYDNEGRLVSYIDVGGDQTQFVYLDGGSEANPTNGEVIQLVQPSATRVFRFDADENLIEDSYLLQNGMAVPNEAYEYDEEGNVTRVTDANMHVTSVSYDEHSRPSLITAADGGTLRFDADGWGEVLVITDELGNDTRIERHESTGQIDVIREGGRRATYEFDDGAQLSQRTDRNGNRVLQTFDIGGRLEQVRVYPASSPTTPERTINFTYDAVGNLLTYNDGVTSGAFTYDLAGRLVSESTNYGSFSLSHQYSYDKIGRQKSYTSPDGTVYRYSYSGQGNLSSIIIPSMGAVTYNAHREGEPARITYPGGVVEEREYDYQLRLRSSVVQDPAGNPIAMFDLTRDAVGNITRKETEQGVYDYGYDVRDRLVSVSSPVLPDETYFYDVAGNRLPADASERAAWSIGVDNRVEQAGLDTFEYDAEGSRTRRFGASAEHRYVYDGEGRLARVNNSAGVAIATYHYDPFGRRLWKEVGGVRTYFHYNNEGLAGEYDAAGALLREYGYSPDDSRFSRPVFQRTATNQYNYYINDHLGTPQKLVSGVGATVWSATYEAYGQAHIEAEAVTSNLRLPGQFFDSETGLHYNNMRDYDPALGVFLEPDPIAAFGALPLYQYAGGDPIGNTDPSGLLLQGLAAVGLFALAAITIYSFVDALAVQLPIVFNNCCTYKERFSALAKAASAVIPTSALLKLTRPLAKAASPLLKALAARALRARNAAASAAKAVAARARSLREAANGTKSVDDILKGAKPGRKTKGKTSQVIKDGGFGQANKDFDALSPAKVKEINTKFGTGRTGELSDGTRVTVRPGSSDGRPTLEIRNPANGRGTEIRFDD